MSEQRRLIYFGIRGRAEPIRLLLEEVGVDYTDHYAEAQWRQGGKEESPFGVLPIYEHGSLRIPESQAILRHLGREFDLYGDSEEDRVRCDVAQEALVAAKSLLGMFPWRDNAEAERDAFVADELPQTLGRLERFLAANPKGPPYFTGGRLSFADLIGFTFHGRLPNRFPAEVRVIDEGGEMDPIAGPENVPQDEKPRTEPAGDGQVAL